MKRCYKCGETKTLNSENFYRDSSRPDGFNKLCKPCSKSKDKARDRREYFKRIDKNNPKREEKKKQSAKRYQEKYKDEFKVASRARSAVYRAIKKGVLIRPETCERCGKSHQRITAAHHDYTKPLDVKWLCPSCHIRWDRSEPKLIK